MRIDIISAAPDLLESPFNHSIIKRAKEKGLAEIYLHNLRDFSDDKHHRVDDYSFSKGAGMVMAIQPIEKAIMIANLGLNPMNNGENIIINIPALTEERRRDLVKQAKAEAEDAKISIRNARKDANTDIKKLEKEGTSEDVCKTAEDDIQKLTDSFIRKVEEHLVIKEAEIMKV